MREFVIRGATGRRSWLALFAPGMALIGLGLLILLFPHLLIAMVAALFMTCGFVLASLGWRMRRGGSRGGVGGGWPHASAD